MNKIHRLVWSLESFLSGVCALMLATACSAFLVGTNAHAKDAAGGAADTGKTASCRLAWMPPSVPDICDWQTAAPLPAARAYSSAVAQSGRIYVAGGFQWNAATSKLVYYDDVLVGVIDAKGSVGSWATAATFKNGRTGLGMAMTKSCVVIAGGSWSDGNSAVYGGDVQTARVGGAGEPSAFVESPHRLNTPRSNHTLLVLEGAKGTYVYAVAGVTQLGDDTVHLDTVEYALLDSNCNVGPWSTAHFDIKGGRSTPQAVLIGNVLYVIGGWGDLDLVDIHADVQYTSLSASGALSPWQTATNRLPSGIYGHASSVIPASTGQGAMLLVTGGQPSTGVYSNAISYAYLVPGQLPSFAPGPWAIFFKPLPAERAGHASVVWNGFVYLIGGSKSGGVYLNDVIFATASPGIP